MKERKAFTVAVGNIPIIPRRDTKKAVSIIKAQKGFLGIHPVYPRGTLLIFDTKNDAIKARNNLMTSGIHCGDNICEIFIPEM